MYINKRKLKNSIWLNTLVPTIILSYKHYIQKYNDLLECKKNETRKTKRIFV